MLHIIYHEKKRLAGQEDGVYGAFLSRLVGYLGISQLRLDYRTLGDYISPDVVEVGAVVHHTIDLDILRRSGLRIGDTGNVAT